MAFGIGRAVRCRRAFGHAPHPLDRDGIVAEEDARLGKAQEAQIGAGAGARGQRRVIGAVERALEQLEAEMALLVVEFRILHDDDAAPQQAQRDRREEDRRCLVVA